MRLPSGWGYRFGPIAAGALLIMLCVVFWWDHQKVLSDFLGFAVSAVTVLAFLWRWGQHRAEAAVVESDPRQVDLAREYLAEKVGEHWRWEAKARGLDDSVGPPVRWRLAAPSMTDHVRQVTAGGRLLFRGGVGAVGELAARFRELRPRRLVILGEAGMGKTTLATVLLLELLKELPQSGGPVPVMVPLSSWDPRVGEDFRDWLARRLQADYPSLGASQYGPTAAKSLVDRGRVLPVLDGLDELPGTARPEALKAIDAALTRVDAVILTCRTAEYLEACSALSPGVFSDAALITPEPLTPADAVDYLDACLERVSGHDHPEPAWPPVLARLAAGAAPLWPALSTPLALWLVDRVYIRARNGEDPTTLCRLPGPQAVTEHLLDALTGAVISANPAVGRRHDRRDPLPLFRPRRGWDPEAAQRWLGYLAHHLEQLHSRDLAWWQLQRAVGASALRLPLVFSAGLAVALLESLMDGPGAGAAAGLLTGALLYAMSFLDAARFQTDRPLNSQPRPERGIVAGLMCGFISGLVAGGFVGGGIAGRVVAGCVVGLLVGIAVGSVSARLPPSPAGLPPDPGLPLRARLRLRTRRLANGLGLGLAYGLVAGLILGLALVSSSGTVSSFVLGLGLGLGIGLLVGLAGATPASPPTGRQRPRPWTLTGIAHRLRPPRQQPPPSYAGLPLRARMRLLGGRLAGGLAYGLPFGAAYGLVLGLVAWGLVVALVVGIGFGLGREIVLNRAFVAALVTLGVGLVLGLVLGVVWGSVNGCKAGLGEGLVRGILHALRSPDKDVPPAEPVLPYADLGFRGRGQLFVRFLPGFLLRLMPPALWGFILLTSVAGGLWVGLTGGGVASGAVVGLVSLAICLLFILVPGVLIAWATTPAPARPGITPDSVLRGDRGLSVFMVIWLGVFIALLGLSGGSAMGAARWFAVGLCSGVSVLLFVAGGAWFVSRNEPAGPAWPAYFVALSWLAAHKKLPLRFMAFLTDAHRLGLLGQAGAVYQFRHSSYQDRLASTYQETGRNSVTAATGQA